MKQKTNIAFLCWENAKWNSDSLYKTLMTDDRFNPYIMIIIPKYANYKNDRNYIFFKSRNYNIFTISDIFDLNAQKPDIIFYQQPWFALKGDFSPVNLSQFALCMDYSYSISPIIELPKTWKLCKHYFKTLYQQFVFNFNVASQFKKRHIYNTIVTGHPKLDVYSEDVKTNPWNNKDKFKVIYAPHHTFSKGTLQWGTFSWNGKQILEIAKNNINTEWVFKPHPWFREQVIQAKIMTEKEINNYFREWEKIGQVYNEGDYFDIFRTSNLMITDCGSFLIEYLPTGSPLIHLVANNGSEKYHSSTNKHYSRHYYKVKNILELNYIFNMLVVEHKDPLKLQRQKDAASITFNSADNIYNYLVNLIEET